VKKILLIGVIALGLGACNSEEEKRAERANITESLPPGCTFHDLGYYNHQPVNVVICKAPSTATTSTRYGCGKNCVRDAITTTTNTPQ
jgi:predicted GTPase